MSLYDASISETVWNGKIPLKVTLDPTDIDIYGNEKVYDPIYVRFVLQLRQKDKLFNVISIRFSWKYQDAHIFL